MLNLTPTEIREHRMVEAGRDLWRPPSPSESREDFHYLASNTVKLLKAEFCSRVPKPVQPNLHRAVQREIYTLVFSCRFSKGWFHFASPDSIRVVDIIPTNNCVTPPWTFKNSQSLLTAFSWCLDYVFPCFLGLLFSLILTLNFLQSTGLEIIKHSCALASFLRNRPS